MVRRYHNGVGLFFVAVGLFTFAPQAQAANISWRLPSGGAFGSTGSWFGGVVPGASDVAVFGLTTNTTFPPFPTPTTYTVTFAATTINKGFVVDDDQVTFDLNGFIYRTPGASNVIGNTHSQTGRLTITDGFWDDNLSGSLQINPKGSLVVSTGGSFFGEAISIAGLGGLLVNNGGQITSPVILIGNGINDSEAVATVDGPNSTLNLDDLVVAASAFGAGRMVISAGGRVETDGEAVVGDKFETTGTVEIDGANSMWVSNGIVSIGREGDGVLNISGGGQANLKNINIGSGAIGPFSTGTGTATVQGANSRLTATNIEVGPLGEGTLTISAGAVVKNTGAVLNVGSNGPGVVNVAAGGRVEAVGSTLGAFSGEGIVTVSGTGAQWINTGTLKVSEFGQGSLSITNGGLVQNVNAIVGVGLPVGTFGGTVTVDGVDSRWTNQGNLTIGDERQGTLAITGGAKVTSLNGTVGAKHIDHGDLTGIGHGVGNVSVTGAGSEWANTGTLTVGESATGTLNIAPGGVLRSADGFVGFLSGSDGAVHLDGSQWINSGNIRVGVAGNGTLTLANGGSVQAQQVSVESHGTLGGNGSITGNLQNSGLVSPGASIGELHVAGAYTQQAGGVLEIEIGGNSISHVDLLEVGAATLDGVLRLRFIPGTIPAQNVVLSATSLSGEFDNVANGQWLSAVNGGGLFKVNYGPGSPFDPNKVILSNFIAIPSGVPGDYNDNGVVDAADYVLWRNGGPLANEVDTPGVVNAADYSAWRARFGNTSGSAASLLETVVPEPASWLLWSSLVGLRGIMLRLRDT